MNRRWRIVITLVVTAALVATISPAVGAIASRTVAGKVTRQGNPIVGVVVTFFDSGSTFRVTCTDANGRYRFPRITVGGDHQMLVGPRSMEYTVTDGTAPCTNKDFIATSGRPWLNYRHPDIHGVFPETFPTFEVPDGSGAFRINVRLRAARHVCFGYKATHVGTGQGDTIGGTAGNDVIVGKGGKDVLTGLGGTDVMCGDGGNDTLRGGGAGDLLFGGNGKRDRMIGGAGADTCIDPVFRKADCEVVNPPRG